MAVHVVSRFLAIARFSVRAFSTATTEITWTANGFPYDPKDIAHLERKNTRSPICRREMVAIGGQ